VENGSDPGGVLLPGFPAGEAVMEAMFLHALHDNPTDDLTRQALADWLQEQGDPRGEILHLCLWLKELKEATQREASEERLRELLASGVSPCVPLITNSIGIPSARKKATEHTEGNRGITTEDTEEHGSKTKRRVEKEAKRVLLSGDAVFLSLSVFFICVDPCYPWFILCSLLRVIRGCSPVVPGE
jgi:uncharacterized protein (TIGR02996 family)